MNKNRKWTKERLAKFRHTMAMKKLHKVGVKVNKQTIVEAFMPNGIASITERWNQEADKTFAALSLERKAFLLDILERS